MTKDLSRYNEFDCGWIQILNTYNSESYWFESDPSHTARDKNNFTVHPGHSRQMLQSSKKAVAETQYLPLHETLDHAQYSTYGSLMHLHLIGMHLFSKDIYAAEIGSPVYPNFLNINIFITS